MTPGTVRRALHFVVALTALVLIVTGIPLWDPDLRARLLGGYGREILEVHLWFGWVFVVAPLLAAFAAARPLLRDMARRFGPPDPPYAWRKVHILSTLVLTFLLSASGVLLWSDLEMPLVLLDAGSEVHLIATWVLLGLIPVHILFSRRKIVARTREILGRVPRSELEPDSFFSDGD